MRGLVPEDVVRWAAVDGDGDAVPRIVLADLDTQIERCNDDAFGEMFHGKIERGEPGDYLQRVMRVGDASVLCGIRFYGGDPGRPFVDLLAWDDAGLNLLKAGRAAAAAYAVFAPERARVLLPGRGLPPALDGVPATCDQMLHAALPASMVEAPAPAGTDRVLLEPASADDAEAFAQVAYEAFRARSPELADRVPIAERSDFELCERGGLLAFWTIDGERAGVIAAERTQWQGLDGYLIDEEVVGERFAGLGSATCAQRRAAEWLVDRGEGNRPLFGVIDGLNAASLRTAAKAGRPAISGRWFIELG
jgi:hypothetical protein